LRNNGLPYGDSSLFPATLTDLPLLGGGGLAPARIAGRKNKYHHRLKGSFVTLTKNTKINDNVTNRAVRIL